MKVYKKLTTLVIFLGSICAFLVVFIVFNPFGSERSVRTPEDRDRIRTSYFDMPVIFEEKVSEDFKRFIMQDISEVYQLYDEFIIYHGRSMEEYILDDSVYQSTRSIHLKGANGLHHPDLLRMNMNRLIDRKGEDYIVIPYEVIEGYRDAVRVIMRHPGIIQELNTLVYDLNRMEEWSTNYEELLRRFYLVGEANQIKSNLGNYPEEFIKRNSQYEYINPSPLFISDLSHLIEDSGDVYGTKIVGMKAERPGRLYELFVAIYIDGKWKLGAGDY